MCPKITQNGSSLQMIIPKNICQSAGLNAGDELYVTTNGGSISLVKPSVPAGEIGIESTFMPSRESSHVVYTIGYESRTVDKFVARLKTHGIRQLIDVREKPISRKKGFSKSALRQLLEEEGIEYVHIPQLGSPSDIRHEFKEGGSDKVFFDSYRKYIKENVPEEVEVLEQYVSNKVSALMCFELSHVHCHRRVLADELKNMGYKVEHL
ncbi:MAG: DUF488 family protein [Candidatus Methanoplasma sp.]|jgi:bifunctional DNA-binding transcriptional regulator/antitoxin component of YhaV-PrlF toxin-antitoxin module|nr:DUF488 family protein [Candidatus Methanoplasma sp.]